MTELRHLFANAGVAVVSLDEIGVEEHAAEESVERFSTFEENALAKARYFRDLTGFAAVLADDSGLEVNSLGGRPGVLSRRLSGRPDLSGAALDLENNRVLLEMLRGHASRRARFVSVVAYVTSDVDLVERGEVEGELAHAPRGRGGFGYDPLFVADELGLTFGEASAEAKERVNHRARAVRRLLERLRPPGGAPGRQDPHPRGPWNR